jgi:hypothetical protein
VEEKELRRPGRRRNDMLNNKQDLRKYVVKVCTGFIWLKIGTSEGLL